MDKINNNLKNVNEVKLLKFFLNVEEYLDSINSDCWSLILSSGEISQIQSKNTKRMKAMKKKI